MCSTLNSTYFCIFRKNIVVPSFVKEKKKKGRKAAMARFTAVPRLSVGAAALMVLSAMSTAVPGVNGERDCDKADVFANGGEDNFTVATIPEDCTTIDLGHTNVGNAGAAAVAEALKTNTAVTQLNLYDSKVGDDGAIALAEMLKTNTALTTLLLFANKIGDDGAASLAKAMESNPVLHMLNLELNNIKAGKFTDFIKDSLRENHDRLYRDEL